MTTSRDVARYDGPRTVEDLRAYSQLLAVNTTPDGRAWRNEALPATFRGNPASVAFAVEYAKALDVSPVTALIGIHIVDGKPTASAGLISALVRRAGHKIRTWTEGRFSDGTIRAITTIHREDDPEFEYRSEWDLDRAVRAGLMKVEGGRFVASKAKSAWSTYPENMLKARTVTECARDAAEDAILGVHYTPEELGADVDENGEVVYTVTQVPHPTPSPADAPPAAATPAQEAAQDSAGTMTPDEFDEAVRVAILDARTAEDLTAVWNWTDPNRGGAVGDHAKVIVVGDENAEETTLVDLFRRAGDAIKAGTHLTAGRDENGDDDGGTPAEVVEDPNPGDAGDAAPVDTVDAVVVEDETPAPAAETYGGKGDPESTPARARLDAVMAGLTEAQIQTVVGYCRDKGLNPANGEDACHEITRAIVTGWAWAAGDEDPEALVARVLGGEVVEVVKVTDTAEAYRREMADRRAEEARLAREDAAQARGPRPPASGSGREAFEAARGRA